MRPALLLVIEISELVFLGNVSYYHRKHYVQTYPVNITVCRATSLWTELNEVETNQKFWFFSNDLNQPFASWLFVATIWQTLRQSKM